jgi:hypothetical protein
MADGIPVHQHFDGLEDPGRLQLHPRNPNQHTPDQLRLYLKIIRGNGWRRSVTISRRSGLVIKGNGAVLAARLGKLRQVPVSYQDYASEREEMQDLLADNELARLSQANESDLAKLLNELEAEGADLELAGILKTLEEPVELKPLSLLPPPKMAWVLIGIPLVNYSRISHQVEKIAAEPSALVETTCNDGPDPKDG